MDTHRAWQMLDSMVAIWQYILKSLTNTYVF
jgi:hypothetical protein